jgi:hypothetical protein
VNYIYKKQLKKNKKKPIKSGELENLVIIDIRSG